MSEIKLTRDLLLKAYALIKAGWAEGEAYYTDGYGVDRYCLGGALAKVVTGDPQEMYNNESMGGVFEQFIELSGIKILPDPWASPYNAIYRFNDRSTYLGVLGAIDKAVKNLEAN